MTRDIDMDVLLYLSKQDWPVTTESVGQSLRISWNTAQLHLYKLTSEGAVKGRRVGRQNQWVITGEGKRRVNARGT